MSLANIITTQQYTHFCVGSLPFSDADKAVEFVLDRPWILPFWPELPQRSARELMISRGLRAFENSWCGYELEEAGGLYALNEALLRRGKKFPILKLQVPGPYTLAKSYAHNGDPVRSIPAAVAAVKRQIAWQCEFLSLLAERFTVALDEPSLSASINCAQKPLAEILAALAAICEFCKKQGVFPGIHNCGEYDPNIFSLPFALFSVSVTRSVSPHTDLQTIKKALYPGVVLAAGVFPACATQLEFEDHKGRYLIDQLKPLFPRNLLISACCGHANASQRWIESIYDKGGMH